MKMDHQLKTMFANDLIKVVEEAPIEHAEMFNDWVNYAFTIVQIISQYIDASKVFGDMDAIIQSNAKSEYNSRLKSICCVLLDFANVILERKM